MRSSDSIGYSHLCLLLASGMNGGWNKVCVSLFLMLCGVVSPEAIASGPAQCSVAQHRAFNNSVALFLRD